VLSLRLAIFAGLFAVALWGLFSLLDNLREPELLRSAKAVVVKGCEPIESDEARRLCPQLLCQKALLDARVFPLRSTFQISVEKTYGAQQLIGGTAHAAAESANDFACVLERNRVVSARVTGPAELATLAEQTDGWTLEQTAP
jgi:hypothetical protein